MPARHQPQLQPGKVYRTHDLAAWSRNPSRLARRLEQEGALNRLAQGLFVHPRQSRFGALPPDDEELMRGFLRGAPFLMTGPERWNTLGLGATAMYPARLVYNTKRSGEFRLGGRKFLLRRVPFPEHPTTEWFVVDLIEHHDRAGVSLETIETSLARALKESRFELQQLRQAAATYGIKATQAVVERAARAAVAAE